MANKIFCSAFANKFLIRQKFKKCICNCMISFFVNHVITCKKYTFLAKGHSVNRILCFNNCLTANFIII